MHHYECIALCKDNSLQRGRFCTRSLASSIYIQQRQVINHECSSSRLCAAAQVVASSSLQEVHEDGLASICILIHSCKMPKKLRRQNSMITITTPVYRRGRHAFRGLSSYFPPQQDAGRMRRGCVCAGENVPRRGR